MDDHRGLHGEDYECINHGPKEFCCASCCPEVNRSSDEEQMDEQDYQDAQDGFLPDHAFGKEEPIDKMALCDDPVPGRTGHDSSCCKRPNCKGDCPHCIPEAK